MTAGRHTMAAAAYHGDPCEQPSLSASIAHTLCTSSPAHAWAAHPKLNPDFARVEEDKFDIGTAAHALMLEGREAVRVVDMPDWRSKAAKEQRDAARLVGQIPLLEKDWTRVQAMCTAVRTQLDAHEADPALLVDGQPEQTITWLDDEFGVWCRARIDWLHDDLSAIDDFKTTKASANPEQWCRSTLYSIGADIQVAMYLRGMQQLFGVTPQWRFVVVETAAPFALSVVSLGPSVLELADSKVEYALRTWKQCLESGDWPAYPQKVAFAEAPSWELQRWLEKEAREEVAA